jgi:hypothetical protein
LKVKRTENKRKQSRQTKKERSKVDNIYIKKKKGKAAIKKKKKQNETKRFVSFLGFFFASCHFRTRSRMQPGNHRLSVTNRTAQRHQQMGQKP